MSIRFLTAGESHGKCLNAIIEGIPSGFCLDMDFINDELFARQKGYGRGERQKIETDKIEFLSGVRFKKTLGSPICIEIKNKDYKNWLELMSSVNEMPKNLEKITIARPGHTDFAGAIKYNFDDIRNVIERSSARETAARVAVGAICQNILKYFEIFAIANVISIGNETEDEKIKQKIDDSKAMGDTLGGTFEIIFKNVPIGLGSYVHYDRRIDGQIAQAVMSIPAVKSVEIGMGAQSGALMGSEVHDEIYFENQKIVRNTNNAGGIEGGVTNGENIVVRGTMKPIPSLKTPLNSIDLKTKKSVKSRFERSDTCALEACAVVAKNMVAFVILNAFLEKFGGDSFEEIKNRYER